MMEEATMHGMEACGAGYWLFQLDRCMVVGIVGSGQGWEQDIDTRAVLVASS
jgi:hypothetical protein